VHGGAPYVDRRPPEDPRNDSEYDPESVWMRNREAARGAE
jgi:hypothetical protein